MHTALAPRLWRDLAADQRGGIAIMSGAMLSVAIAAAAFAIDVGSLYLERREAQAAADLAALAAAADLEQAETVAATILKANGIDKPASLIVTKGHYEPDPKISHELRFKPGEAPFNAVSVELTKPGHTYFAKVFTNATVDMGVKAIAATTAQATFSIGSRLLSVREGLVNKLLGALLGANIQLSAMDYSALIDAKVELGDFLDALATEVGVTAGTYTDVLNANATVGNVIAAAATVTGASGNAGASAVLNSLLEQASGSGLTVPLSSMIDLGPLAQATIGDNNPGLDASLSAMEIVSSAITLANGDNQVSIDLGTTIPGLLSLKIDLAIGEPPQNASWVGVGEPNAIVRTAQTRLRLVAEVGGSGLLAGARVKLPVFLDIAYAEARLDEITCANGDPETAEVKIGARPGIADLYIGEVTDAAFGNFSTKPSVAKANIVDVPLIKVRGKAHLEVGNMSEEMMTFDMEDVRQGTAKTTGTSDYTQSLVASLLGETNLEVSVGNLAIGLPALIGPLVKALLVPVAPVLDGVLHSLLTALGVHLGEADVRVHGIRCGTAVLAG